MEKVDFQKFVQDEFYFLVEYFGFTSKYIITEDKFHFGYNQEIQYASKYLLIRITHSSRGEIDVLIDENPPSHCFQLSLFLHVYHPEIEKTLGYGIADSNDEVHRELNRQAEILLQYGKPLLRHDKQVFEKMKTATFLGRD